MDKHNEKNIKFKVMSSNKTGDIFNYVIPNIIKLLQEQTKYNKQVLKVDYSLLKKYDDLIKPLLNDTKNSFKDISSLYLSTNEYNIYLKVQLRFNDINENHFDYYEDYKYICSIKDLCISEFYKYENIDYIDINEQLKVFDNCLNLIEQFRTERAKLKPYCLSEISDLKRI